MVLASVNNNNLDDLLNAYQNNYNIFQTVQP